ncbi:hypothetical protein K438DRAFT_1748055 [Mycena galopus ATCC 62051]|nr:hypothetical protein K438DRAFT_1748055 [Mycena galopus ATCC 62051]
MDFEEEEQKDTKSKWSGSSTVKGHVHTPPQASSLSSSSPSSATALMSSNSSSSSSYLYRLPPLQRRMTRQRQFYPYIVYPYTPMTQQTAYMVPYPYYQPYSYTPGPSPTIYDYPPSPSGLSDPPHNGSPPNQDPDGQPQYHVIGYPGYGSDAIERGRTPPRIGIVRRSSMSSTNSTEGSGSGASDSDLNVPAAYRSASQLSLERFSEVGSEKSVDTSLSSSSREE